MLKHCALHLLALNLELDALRSRVLDRYRGIDAPIHMIMSTSSAGDGEEGPAPWVNRIWRAGVERLTRELPSVSVSRLDADHGLVFTHAAEIARIIGSR